MPSNSLITIRQTAAEVLAYAMLELFPEVMLMRGKATDLGFYYDFSMPQRLTEQMLPLIEERMRGVIKEKLDIQTPEMMPQNAMELFAHLNQPYLVEELEDCQDSLVKILKINSFYDVARGLCGDCTELAQAFKLLRIQQEGSVVRIVGTACQDKQELKDFLKKLKSAKESDHRLLGAERKLFIQHEGDFLWLPAGQRLREDLIQFLLEEEKKMGIQSVLTPSEPQKSSLHAVLYQQNRILPTRYSEFHEKVSSENLDDLNGLFISRTHYSDSTTIFCSEKEVVAELISCLQLIDKTAKMLGLTYVYVVKGQKPIKAHWKESVGLIERALNELNFQFVIDKENVNPYSNRDTGLKHCGPIVDVEVTDKLDRTWRISSLGINLKVPELFGLEYLDSKRVKHTPMMIEMSVFKSLELFIALMLEKKM
jgi:threonyl-tRNA synthetase